MDHTVGENFLLQQVVLRFLVNVMPCQAMPMVVAHDAGGPRNILVFLGRMAEAMGHALQ